MIVDAFIFRDEFDCLEIRLHELADHVDRFVLVEGDHTFQGNPDPLRFGERREDFAHWPITYVPVTEWPTDTDDPWHWEAWQRNAILNGITDVGPDDIVLVSDADEIPNHELLEEVEGLLAQGIFQVGFSQALYFYQLDNRLAGDRWNGTQAMRASGLRLRQPEPVRQGRHNSWRLHGEGGWHFCNLGDVDWLIAKLESYSHTEVNTAANKDRSFLSRCIAESEVIEPAEEMVFRVDPRGLPDYVLANRERFAGLLHPERVKV